MEEKYKVENQGVCVYNPENCYLDKVYMNQGTLNILGGIMEMKWRNWYYNQFYRGVCIERYV